MNDFLSAQPARIASEAAVGQSTTPRFLDFEPTPEIAANIQALRSATDQEISAVLANDKVGKSVRFFLERFRQNRSIAKSEFATAYGQEFPGTTKLPVARGNANSWTLSRHHLAITSTGKNLKDPSTEIWHLKNTTVQNTDEISEETRERSIAVVEGHHQQAAKIALAKNQDDELFRQRKILEFLAFAYGGIELAKLETEIQRSGPCLGIETLIKSINNALLEKEGFMIIVRNRVAILGRKKADDNEPLILVPKLPTTQSVKARKKPEPEPEPPQKKMDIQKLLDALEKNAKNFTSLQLKIVRHILNETQKKSQQTFDKTQLVGAANEKGIDGSFILAQMPVIRTKLAAINIVLVIDKTDLENPIYKIDADFDSKDAPKDDPLDILKQQLAEALSKIQQLQSQVNSTSEVSAEEPKLESRSIERHGDTGEQKVREQLVQRIKNLERALASTETARQTLARTLSSIEGAERTLKIRRVTPIDLSPDSYPAALELLQTRLKTMERELAALRQQQQPAPQGQTEPITKEKLRALSEEIELYKLLIADEKAKLESANAEITTLNHKLQSTNSTIVRSEAHVRELEIQVNNQNQSNSELSKQLVEAKAALAKAQTEKTAAQAKAKSLEAEQRPMAEILERLRRSEKRAEQADEARIREKRRADEASSHLTTERARLKDTTKQPAIRPGELIEWKNAATRAIAEKDEAKTAQGHAEAEVRRLKLELATAKRVASDAIKGLEVAQAEVERSKSGIPGKAPDQKLAARLTELESSLAERNRKIASMETQLADLKDENARREIADMFKTEAKVGQDQAPKSSAKAVPAQVAKPSTPHPPPNSKPIAMNPAPSKTLSSRQPANPQSLPTEIAITISKKDDLVAQAGTIIGRRINSMGIKKGDFRSALAEVRALPVSPDLEATKTAIVRNLEGFKTEGKWLHPNLETLLKIK